LKWGEYTVKRGWGGNHSGKQTGYHYLTDNSIYSIEKDYFQPNHGFEIVMLLKKLPSYAFEETTFLCLKKIKRFMFGWWRGKFSKCWRCQAQSRRIRRYWAIIRQTHGTPGVSNSWIQNSLYDSLIVCSLFDVKSGITKSIILDIHMD
jgi:hypothetical protein